MQKTFCDKCGEEIRSDGDVLSAEVEVGDYDEKGYSEKHYHATCFDSLNLKAK